ncbi:TIGR02391 family protein [Kitasatospora indigofera]|uniref:TIGR02391 family protein n=1 Tax=Kitasatospora indigofera TaxID=67307 RepID=UPI0036B30640
MHPWVWGSVQGLWSSGYFREAVSVAARAINAQSQAKLARRDVGEGILLSDAFSPSAPIRGHPRLRLTADDGGETFKNRHNGAAAVARGLYSAIRNPLAHEHDIELEGNEALEYLAAFSILARWVEQSTVGNAP